PEAEPRLSKAGARLSGILSGDSRSPPSPLEAFRRKQLGEQIPPRRIFSLDESNLPVAPLALGEALAHVLAMLPRAIGKNARHADVEYAARPTGHDVDVVELSRRLRHGSAYHGAGQDPGSARPDDRALRPGTQTERAAI